jgi:hypothetical protein
LWGNLFKMRANYIFFLSFLICFSGFTQQIVRSTIGSIGSAMGNGTLTIQQTAGQPSATSFVKNDDGSALRQGFHQPYYYEIERNDLNATIYPNPNNGQFSFQVALQTNEIYNYFLLDQNGKEILKKSGFGNQLTEVSIEQPVTGFYHLKISSGKRFSSFKIYVIH